MTNQQSNSLSNTGYIWNQNWIQKYETYDNIIKKFMYANEISENYFKNEFSTGEKGQKLIETLGFSEFEYQKKLNDMVFSRIGNCINGIDTIEKNPRFCKECYLVGFQSIFHQIPIFSSCIYHKNEKLKQYSDIWKYQLSLSDVFTSELKIDDIYNIWSKKLDIIDIKYYKFINLPPIFMDNVKMNQNVELEGFDTNDETVIKQLLDDKILSRNIGITVSIPLLEGKNLSRWWERQRRQKIFLHRKLSYGTLVKKDLNKQGYFIPEIQKNGFKYSYWDIKKSIDHYIKKMLDDHKFCIKKNTDDCLVSKFCHEFEWEQSSMQTNYRLARNNRIDPLYNPLKQVVLKEFIRKNQYLYDPDHNEFKNPIKHLSESVLNIDTIGFHFYHDRIYLIMIHVLDELEIPHNFKYQGLQIGYSQNKVWIYYCPSINNIIKFLLYYCDSNDGCNIQMNGG